MLYRKISKVIEEHLKSGSDKIMIVEGARQVGKSFIIREVGRKLFPNFHEINFVRDNEGAQIFKNIKTIDDFYFMLSSQYGNALGDFDDTLIFLDEIQEFPQYLTWLKFLREDRKYRFIASGSMLGMALRHTTSIPIGSTIRKEMFQLDFEEFMMANNVGWEAISHIKDCYLRGVGLSEAMHIKVMDLFRRYLLVGGMPEAVNTYIETQNITKVREVQAEIHTMYADDASKYESESKAKLLVKRIYDMIPSQMENKKKRIVVKEISGKEGDRFDRYNEEFEYLISSGITLSVNAISNPRFPLTESLHKNLLKLYLNDVGLLTNELYRNNIKPVIDTECSVNLGAVYENVVAQELRSHGYKLFYYDQRKVGEVDFIIDDYMTLSPLPIEVKSGKDYRVHSALNRLMDVKDYGIKRAVVLSNNREVKEEGSVVYMPVYFVMWFDEKGL